MKKKPTDAQRRILANISQGRMPSAGLSGRSQHGGFAQTWFSLCRRKWVTTDGQITDAGLAALAEVTP